MATDLIPPPLSNDCFALPPGVDWTPVDQALATLKARLRPVAGTETCVVAQALGRILAAPVHSARANPPMPNSAVDGYGMAHDAIVDGVNTWPLVVGRSAAGQPFDGEVPLGHAIRILTGASLPRGVDTVVLQEDVHVSDTHVAFHGPLRRGANTRQAGEDVSEGAELLPEGRRLTVGDIALLTATGVADVPVRKRLRVAVLSTGDELAQPGQSAGPHQIFDANRPMLLAMAARLGYELVDLGAVADSRETIAATLDAGAAQADVILTSGGASAGDEDHVSALLRESGSLAHWRIAIKPGRPLALAVWQGTPVFGLPGNPVAALVTALLFARPAMGLLAGEGWRELQRLSLPAGFAKSKKPGRREYLRARLRDGRIEVFASEGSGRISGLSWAEGLVELPDRAADIVPGDPVTYLPFSGFGI